MSIISNILLIRHTGLINHAIDVANIQKASIIMLNRFMIFRGLLVFMMVMVAIK